MSSLRDSQSSSSSVTALGHNSGTATSSPMPVFSSPDSSIPSSFASDPSQEPARINFAESSSNLVPLPSFSCNVASKSGSSNNQESSTSVPNSTPPAGMEALKLPVSGQSPTMRPFSYNVVSTSVASSSDQPPQSNMATGPGFVQGDKLNHPSTMTTTPPIPAQSGYSNPFGPGPGVSNIAAPVQSPFPVPRGLAAVATAAGISLSGNSQPHYPMEVSQNTWLTNPAFMQEHGNTPAFPGPLPINPGHPGPVNIPPPALLPPASIGRPAAMDSSSASVRPMYPSLPSMVPPSQAPWFHPPQVSGLQRPPFVAYPGVIPGSFPIPIRGTSIPSVPLPDSQPPGVLPVGPPGGISIGPVGVVQPASSFEAQLPPPGTEWGTKANDHSGKDGSGSKKEDADAWTAHKTETGVVYYYNALTGESTYERPASFKGEPDKVTAQPTPVSWEKLGGTDWSLVATNDGKKYYYNSVTKISSWQVPQEVAELRKKQESEAINANTGMVQSSSPVDKGSTPLSLPAPAVITGGRDATSIKPSTMVVPSSALDLVKKKLQDAGTAPVSAPVPVSAAPHASDLNGLRPAEAPNKGQQSDNSKDKLKDANGDGNMSDSSSDSDDEDRGPTKEECIVQFKEMLKERGVAPFSKWDKELPKILFDPRFKAVPSYSARRAIFDHYVRTRAEEERKEKRAAQRAAVEGFKQLLEEASEHIDHKTDYQSFKRKWGKDPRCEALDRKERELLLNEKVLPLKKAAEERRAAAASSFKTMLREREDITISSRWSRVKDGLREDPRYKSVKHEDREVLFNEYISELRAAEEEAERASKAKKDELEKLKEREREMRKRKERDEQEMERVRLKVRRKEAVASYQALLVETIKDPKASWTECKPKLEKDPQGRATNSDLDKADTEKLFREHVKILYERCAREFRALLSDVITAEAASQATDEGKSVLSSWSAAKQLLKSDPRYSKLPSKDRESLWRRHCDEMQRKSKGSGDPNGEKQNTVTKNQIVTDYAARQSSRAARTTHGRR